MENKQTAIEWLEKEMYKLDYDRHFSTFKEFDIEKGKLWNQAKQMEKEQIIDSFDEGFKYDINNGGGQQYYNETYKQQDK
jgi:hypothetical protein